MLRMIGLLPIVRSRAFDMVSDGTQFQLSIPPKNRFVTGKDEITTVSSNSLENLRPKVIYDALLMPAIDEKGEIAVLEEGVQEVEDPKTHKMATQQNYHLLVIRHGRRTAGVCTGRSTSTAPIWIFIARRSMTTRARLRPMQFTPTRRSTTEFNFLL